MTTPHPPLRPALDPATLAVVLGRPDRVPGAPVGPAVQLSSTFVSTAELPDPSGAGLPGYGRPDNATVAGLESVLAALEGAESAVAFSSGMAAISAVAQLADGARVIAPTSAYNTTVELFADLAATGRVELVQVDVADTAAVLHALRAPHSLRASDRHPTMLWLESPTNPLLDVADLATVLEAARECEAISVVDNTFATPLLQRPMTLGADLVVHSATKYLAGHSDVVLGAVVGNRDDLLQRVRRHRRLHGAIAGPFEAWLALRGVRTLDVRLGRAVASAGVLAERLSTHPNVTRVRYPGLVEAPGHELAARQMTGFGAMLAIEVAGDRATADAVVSRCRLWVPATSLGGVESLIERRRRIASEPPTVPDNLLRLSVGIENVDDLWADLNAALTTP